MDHTTPTLDFLTPNELKCCAMFYFDGLTQATIAKGLGRSQPSVSRYIKRGTKKLKARHMVPRRLTRDGDRPKLIPVNPKWIDHLGPGDVKAMW